MPPSTIPDQPDGPEGEVAPEPRRPSRSRAKAAPAPSRPAPAAPARDGEEAPVEDAASGRKVTAARVRKALEQRTKVARRASSLLKFVSDPTRLQVLMILVDGEHHVGALCERLGQSQPAVSHHLALLRHGGVIAPRRAGKNNFYSLSDSGRVLAEVARILLRAE